MYRRWYDHRKPSNKANVSKYIVSEGVYGFDKEVLFLTDDEDVAMTFESVWVCSLQPICNKTPDGQGGGVRGFKHSEQTKRNMSDSRKGEKNGMYEKTHSEETKRKQSEVKKGKYIGEKNPMYGRTGDTAPGFGKTGELNPMFGKPSPNRRNDVWEHSDEIVEMYVSGDWTQSQISEHFGCSSPTIGNILKDRNVIIRSHRKHPVWDTPEKVVEMFNDGNGKQHIANHFGCTRRTVYSILKAHSVGRI